MLSMELRRVEEAKAHCAREHFRAISGESVLFDVVDSYGRFWDLVRMYLPWRNYLVDRMRLYVAQGRFAGDYSLKNLEGKVMNTPIGGKSLSQQRSRSNSCPSSLSSLTGVSSSVLPPTSLPVPSYVQTSSQPQGLDAYPPGSSPVFGSFEPPIPPVHASAKGSSPPNLELEKQEDEVETVMPTGATSPCHRVLPNQQRQRSNSLPWRPLPPRREPGDMVGNLNIGAGTQPMPGAYNIDIAPNEPAGVYPGNATELTNIEANSQSRIVIDNPFKFDPHNSAVDRVLRPGGRVRISGVKANRWFRDGIKAYHADSRYELVEGGQELQTGCRSGGRPMRRRVEGSQPEGTHEMPQPDKPKSRRTKGNQPEGVQDEVQPGSKPMRRRGKGSQPEGSQEELQREYFVFKKVKEEKKEEKKEKEEEKKEKEEEKKEKEEEKKEKEEEKEKEKV